MRGRENDWAVHIFGNTTRKLMLGRKRGRGVKERNGRMKGESCGRMLQGFKGSWTVVVALLDVGPVRGPVSSLRLLAG